jgi:ATP synthase protein I
LRQDKKNSFNAWALMSAIVSQLVGSILIGIFLGKWLDAQVGTFPLFLVIGLLLGLVSGTLGTLKLIQHFSEEGKKND